MPSYTTNPQSFAKIRRKLIVRLLLISLIPLVLIFGWEVWQIIQTGEGNLSTFWFIVPIFLGTIIFNLRRTIAQQREIWNSIEIEIDHNRILYRQLRIPEVVLERSKIINIIESKQGLCIQTADRTRSLLIPINLDRADYLEIKTILSNWTEIKPASTANNIRNIILVIIYVLGFIIFLFSPYIWLSLVLGIAIIVYNQYFNRLIQRHEAIDPQSKKFLSRSFILTIFIVCFSIFGKLSLRYVFPKYLEKDRQSEQSLLHPKFSNKKRDRSLYIK